MSCERIALVTGAGSGIGRAVAVALAGAGFAIVLVGRRTGPLEETATLVPDDGRAMVRATDVTDPGAVATLFDDVRARFGRLDLLFNNAGAALPAHLPDEIEPDEWRRLIDVNVTGAYLCARAAFAMMRAQSPRGGRIINNGSVSAQVPRPGSIAYATSKHAITGLTRSLALDGRAHGIACGQIDIGNAATDLGGAGATSALRADGSIATEPTFAVEHVAGTVLHMANLPLDVNIPFVTLMATGMPLLGRG